MRFQRGKTIIPGAKLALNGVPFNGIVFTTDLENIPSFRLAQSFGMHPLAATQGFNIDEKFWPLFNKREMRREEFTALYGEFFALISGMHAKNAFKNDEMHAITMKGTNVLFDGAVSALKHVATVKMSGLFGRFKLEWTKMLSDLYSR